MICRTCGGYYLYECPSGRCLEQRAEEGDEQAERELSRRDAMNGHQARP